MASRGRRVRPALMTRRPYMRAGGLRVIVEYLPPGLYAGIYPVGPLCLAPVAASSWGSLKLLYR